MHKRNKRKKGESNKKLWPEVYELSGVTPFTS